MGMLLCALAFVDHSFRVALLWDTSPSSMYGSIARCVPDHCVHPPSHVIRFIYGMGLETMEITGPQMVLTLKLTTFAWNVWDGQRPTEVSDLPSLELILSGTCRS